MKLTIIKHGKTDLNLEGKRQGRTDLQLNKVGKKEVSILKGKIQGTYNIIISSPLKRAYETAQILFPDQEITKDDLLLEYDFGELEGTEFSKPHEEFPNNKVDEYNGMKLLMPNEGESFEDIVNRCKEFINKLKSKYTNKDRIAVVTHSTILEIIKALIEKKPWHSYLGQAKEFHGMVRLEI